MAALLPVIACHPVVAFMVIGLGGYFMTAAIPPIVNAQVLPFDLPLHGVLGGVLGVYVGAFLVTGALAGRAALHKPTVLKSLSTPDIRLGRSHGPDPARSS
jgi:hypothetical protein